MNEQKDVRLPEVLTSPATDKAAPGETPAPDVDGAPAHEGVSLKRNLTLLNAISIVVGCVVGSGIFLSPSGVAKHAGSVGASLIIWAICGFEQLGMALCYSELGTVYPSSGGDYYYVYKLIGGVPAFMTLWLNIIIQMPASIAVLGRTVGTYFFRLAFPTCVVPDIIITLTAILSITAALYLNFRSVNVTVKVLDILGFSKIFALGLIIITGIVMMARGNIKNFQNGFAGTNTDPSSLAAAVFSGFFSYNGWENLNVVLEELINPERNVSLSVAIAMSLVVTIYVLVNIAYFSVMTPADMVASKAVALTFADRTLGNFAWIVPIFVVLSCIGTINGLLMSTSRLMFSGGRLNQLPDVLSLIHIDFFTPGPALIFIAFLACMYSLISEVQSLIQYLVLVGMIKLGFGLASYMVFRWKRLEPDRPVKMNIVMAIVVTLVAYALIILNIFKNPINSAIGIGFFLLGIPVYFMIKFIKSRNLRCSDIITAKAQQLLLSVQETKKEQ